MKILYFRDEELRAEKIIKTDNALYGYINDIEVFSFENVSDFSGYQLAEGQEFDEPESTLKEHIQQLEQDNASLWYENIMIKSEVELNKQEIADLWYEAVMRGEM